MKQKNYFSAIKSAFTKAPVLISTDFEKYFLIFSYASKETIVVGLLQKNKQSLEHPISFFIHALRDAKLNYSLIEKHRYFFCAKYHDQRCISESKHRW